MSPPPLRDRDSRGKTGRSAQDEIGAPSFAFQLVAAVRPNKRRLALLSERRSASRAETSDANPTMPTRRWRTGSALPRESIKLIDQVQGKKAGAAALRPAHLPLFRWEHTRSQPSAPSPMPMMTRLSHPVDGIARRFLENRWNRPEPCEARHNALSNVIEFSAERLGLAAH
jgi:hypothetical protein